jgi:Holliday junction DNA helicase RuvB
VSWLTCIAATTRPDRIDEAVMSRFPIRLRLDPYTDEEMIQIITQMAATHDVELDRGEAEVLALAAGGVPRMARDLVDAYVSLGYVGRRTAEEALRLVGVDADGLTKDHVSYLKALDRLEGQAGAVPLSNLLRCSQGQLMMLERLLIQKGMITMSPRGRVLLARGDRRLRGTPSNDGREGRRG